ncbi:MAG TPA: glycosyltransferase family 39 protein [Candidatus Fermentibacter daniensis]|nr:glycosyltransferase family 39 protein [Candidatus Fermentibacter daniensis]
MENHRAVLTAVALAVTIPRLALFSALGGYLPEPPRDQEIYLRLAGSFLDGEGLSFSVDEHLYKVSNSRSDDPMAAWTADPDLVFGLGRAGAPSALVEPGYPMLLAAVMSVAGRVSGAVFLVNLIAQLLGAWAMTLLAARLWGGRRGMPAGLLFALYPYNVFYTANAMTEAVHIAMIPVILLATVRAMDGRSRSSLPGLATGLLFLVRSTALFILPVQALFLWKARGWRAAAAVVAGFILCAAPWVARNRIELGSPILLPTKGSLNLWMRNNPEALALEGISVPDWVPVNSAELLEYPDDSRFVTEVERSSELGRRSLAFMIDNPALMCWLTVERLASFLSAVPSTPSGMAWIPGALFYVPAACLAGVAFYRSRKSRESALLLSVFLLYCAMHAMSHGGLRYRLPVDSILMAAAVSVIPLRGGADGGAAA